jgi:hypothetical protein
MGSGDGGGGGGGGGFCGAEKVGAEKVSGTDSMLFRSALRADRRF